MGLKSSANAPFGGQIATGPLRRAADGTGPTRPANSAGWTRRAVSAMLKVAIKLTTRWPARNLSALKISLASCGRIARQTSSDWSITCWLSAATSTAA